MINPLGMFSSQQDTPVSLSVKLSDFNKPVVIDIPENAVKFDDLMKSLMPEMKVATGSSRYFVQPEPIGSPSAIFNVKKYGKCEKSGIERNTAGITFTASGELLTVVNNRYWQIELDTLNPKYGLIFDSNTKFIGRPQSAFKVGDCITAVVRSGEARVSTISLQ